MILVVLAAGWLFYGLPTNKSDSTTERSGEEQEAGALGEQPDAAPQGSGSISDRGMGTPPTEQAPGEIDGGQTASDSPYLLAHLPFKEEEVTSIMASWNGKRMPVPAERQYVLLQSLRLTDMKSAAAQPERKTAANPVVLQFELADSSFELSYDLDNNAFEYQGRSYYADDQVLLLMQGLFPQIPELAALDTLLERARVEHEQAGTIEPKALDAKRAEVEGLDFNGWESRLEQMKPEDIVWEIPFYDDFIGQVGQARLYKGGVLKLNGRIVFDTAAHETVDGVKVGIGIDDVLNKLGPEALKLASEWSYKVGDYYRFRVYFEDKKVKYIVLCKPL